MQQKLFCILLLLLASCAKTPLGETKLNSQPKEAESYQNYGKLSKRFDKLSENEKQKFLTNPVIVDGLTASPILHAAKNAQESIFYSSFPKILGYENSPERLKAVAKLISDNGYYKVIYSLDQKGQHKILQNTHCQNHEHLKFPTCFALNEYLFKRDEALTHWQTLRSACPESHTAINGVVLDTIISRSDNEEFLPLLKALGLYSPDNQDILFLSNADNKESPAGPFLYALAKSPYLKLPKKDDDYILNGKVKILIKKAARAIKADMENLGQDYNLYINNQSILQALVTSLGDESEAKRLLLITA